MVGLPLGRSGSGVRIVAGLLSGGGARSKGVDSANHVSTVRRRSRAGARGRCAGQGSRRRPVTRISAYRWRRRHRHIRVVPHVDLLAVLSLLGVGVDLSATSNHCEGQGGSYPQ
jgi:hypothetical protein